MLYINLSVIFINCLFENIFEMRFFYGFIIGKLFVVFSIILYFFELLNSDAILNIKKILIFWISVGLFIFYLPLSPFDIVEKYYLNNN
jgi:hypothetical protein